jgi:hypothetical protein
MQHTSGRSNSEPVSGEKCWNICGVAARRVMRREYEQVHASLANIRSSDNQYHTNTLSSSRGKSKKKDKVVLVIN